MSVIARRMAAQLLSGAPARDPVSVAERLLAVQAQDGSGVRLAIRARTAGLTAADLEFALTEERSVLITWLCRGTLHLVSSADYWWLHAVSTSPLLRATERRLAQTGVSPAAAERGVKTIAAALTEEGPLTRYQLRDRLAGVGVPTEGQALVHLLMLATLRGVAVRGPVIGRQHAYALVRDWLGPRPRIDRDRALAELARRYLAGHGPADDRDLAKWAGLPLRDVRAGLAAASKQLTAREDGLLEPRGAKAPPGLPGPRLLGAFDPVLLGWRSREPITGPHEAAIVTGGLFRPFALVGGKAAARWRIERDEVAIEPFSELDAAALAALRADATDVIRYLRA